MKPPVEFGPPLRASGTPAAGRSSHEEPARAATEDPSDGHGPGSREGSRSSRHGSIAYDSDLVIESHNSNFALSSSLGHVLDLILDCGFNALDTRYIGLVLLSVAQELVRPIAKLLKVLVEL